MVAELSVEALRWADPVPPLAVPFVQSSAGRLLLEDIADTQRCVVALLSSCGMQVLFKEPSAHNDTCGDMNTSGGVLVHGQHPRCHRPDAGW